MENKNKITGMTDELKHFHRMRKGTRTREQAQAPEITIDVEIEEDEDDTPEDILYEAADVLMDCAEMVSRAAFLVGLMQDHAYDEETAYADDDDEDDTPAEDSCDACPYGGRCGNEHGTMVLVARPGGDNTVMTMDELAEEISGIFSGRPGTYDMHPVPGTEDLYYTIPEKKPLKRGGKTFYKAPAVVFGIDEDEGEIVSPGAKQLYAAMRYFENATRTIKTREGGETAVFCFD